MNTKNTVECNKLSVLRMGTKHGMIVDVDGDLKEYIGIGWVTLRKATAADKKKYSAVICNCYKPKRARK